MPDRSNDPSGNARIVAPQDASATITRLLETLDVPSGHGAASLGAAAAALSSSGIDDPSLVDLEHVPFVTIDNDGSRDLDQALHVEGSADDGWRVRYALADTTRHVVPGGALWDAALVRGATLYAPDRALPMLPRALSEGLLSLEPGAARRSLVFDMRVTPGGAIARTDVLRARIRSRLQLTYPGVQRTVDGEASLEAARADNPASLAASVAGAERTATLDSLHALASVGRALAARRRADGTVAFDRTESDIRVAGDPPAFDVTPHPRLPSESWNEQLSLACNVEGARLLVALEADDPTLEPVYRTHDAPDRGRLRNLDDTLVALADAIELEGAWRRDPKRDASLADWFEALPPRPARRRRAVQRQVLRAQQASRYGGEPGRHHALAADAYARFSSPMREIVGVHTHRVLLRAMGLEENAPAEALPEARTALRDAVVAAGEASRARQKTLDRAVLFEVLAALFEADLAGDDAPWRDGTVLGVEPNKLHVGLDRMALDVKLWREDLETSTGVAWTLDTVSARPGTRRAPAASGSPDPETLFLGDGVRLRVRGFDADSKRYRFDVRLLDIEAG